METLNPVSMGVNGLFSLGVFGAYKLYNKSKKSKLRGLCVQVGKTSLCEKLSNEHVIFFDVDNFVKENKKEIYEKYYEGNQIQFMINSYPVVLAHLQAMINNFENISLVIVSKCYDYLKQLGIQEKHIWSFIPDKELLDKLPYDEEQKRKVEKECFILNTKARKVYVIDSFSNTMYNIIRKKLKMKAVLNL